MRSPHTALLISEVFLMTWEEELYQVVDVFKDHTMHQAAGKFPRIGDLVRVIDEDGDHGFAISNDEKYSAFFQKTTQLRTMDQSGSRA